MVLDILKLRLADIPEDWYCPECGVTKFDFELLKF